MSKASLSASIMWSWIPVPQSLAVGLFIGLVCSVIGLFFKQIILFDGVALGIAAGVCCNQFTAYEKRV